MSKRYVIQVLETVVGENGEPLENVGEWKNVQHPAGGDWKTRSRTTALNDAVTLVFKGETRELRIAESKPVYETVPLAELDVAEAVAIAKHTAAEVAKYGYGEPGDDDYVAPASIENDDDTDDGSENDAPIAFELVDESGSDGNAHNNDGPAYTHGDDPTGN